MQGKGIVKFFLAVISLVCIYQYLLILPAKKVESQADAFAKEISENYPEEQRDAVEKKSRGEYLDSMSTETVFSIPYLSSYTYQELKSQQLALGLDLKGGMSVVLQVDLREFIKTLANNSKDPTFEKALDLATEKLKTEQTDYVTLFVQSWREIADGKPLYTLFRRSDQLKDEINANSSDGEVERLLQQKSRETVNLTYNLLKKRIDKLGVAQPNVSLDEARSLILVELPGIDNPQRARDFLKASAILEFWECYRVSDPNLLPGFANANQYLIGAEEYDMGGLNENVMTIDTVYTLDSLGNEDPNNFTIDTLYTTNPETAARGPLFDVLTLNQGNLPLPVVGLANKNQKEKISAYLDMPEVKKFFPKDVKFLWARNAFVDFETRESTNDFELYAVKVPPTGKPLLSGDRVTSAESTPDPTTGELTVSLRMDAEGSRIWGQMTEKAASDEPKREIAIVLDDEVASAPQVRAAIKGGSSSITGNFTAQESQDLASILQIGKLPVKTEIIQDNVIGPSLGEKNINRSIKALVIGFILVLLFMIFYYGTGGIVSILALLLNIFFIFGSLASLGTVLTLPGIAGIVLTIGMAVDANVIIFERIREELREGKSLKMAISDGFANSYSAIIDANVTTFLTAIVLFWFGLGPIKGFAAVLMVGVISSFVTAVLAGRLMIDWWISKGNSMSFWTNSSKNAFTDLNIDWLSKRKVTYLISGSIILLGVISMFTRGFDLGIDFKGGYAYNIEFQEDVNADQIREALTAPFGSTPVVKAVDAANTYNVVTEYNIDDTSDDAAQKVLTALYGGINQMTGGKLKIEEFQDTETVGSTHIVSSSKVGPTIADDIKSSSWKAASFALLLIFLYILIRFSKKEYSMGAVAALFHDVFVTLGLFSILHGIVPWSMEIDQAFIAALLTVIGYSINDTVVVFDRIREFVNTYTGKSKEEVINMAINSTVSRTVITSLTTLFVVLILFIFGGGSIKGFSFALLIGVIVGTYSSIFIATPILSDLTKELSGKSKQKEDKVKFSKAAAKAR